MVQKKTKQKLRKKRQNSKRRSRRVRLRDGGKLIPTTPTVKTLIAADKSYLYPTNKIKNLDFQTYFLIENYYRFNEDAEHFWNEIIEKLDTNKEYTTQIQNAKRILNNDNSIFNDNQNTSLPIDVILKNETNILNENKDTDMAFKNMFDRNKNLDEMFAIIKPQAKIKFDTFIYILNINPNKSIGYYHINTVIKFTEDENDKKFYAIFRNNLPAYSNLREEINPNTNVIFEIINNKNSTFYKITNDIDI
jgi:hypothetical protein